MTQLILNVPAALLSNHYAYMELPPSSKLPREHQHYRAPLVGKH